MSTISKTTGTFYSLLWNLLTTILSTLRPSSHRSSSIVDKIPGFQVHYIKKSRTPLYQQPKLLWDIGNEISTLPKNSSKMRKNDKRSMQTNTEDLKNTKLEIKSYSPCNGYEIRLKEISLP